MLEKFNAFLLTKLSVMKHIRSRCDMAECNRRQSPRQNMYTTVQVFLRSDNLTGSTESGDILPVSMYNQSENGLYIEIDRALPPGSNLSIKMTAPEKHKAKDAYPCAMDGLYGAKKSMTKYYVSEWVSKYSARSFGPIF